MFAQQVRFAFCSDVYLCHFELFADFREMRVRTIPVYLMCGASGVQMLLTAPGCYTFDSGRVPREPLKVTASTVWKYGNRYSAGMHLT